MCALLEYILIYYVRDVLRLNSVPDEDPQFGQTSGGLLALEGDAGFVIELAGLLDPAQHALVDH